VNYGEFDLDFAVDLMQFMLDECWKQRPEERAARQAPPYLFLPTDQELVEAGRHDLKDKVRREEEGEMAHHEMTTAIEYRTFGGVFEVMGVMAVGVALIVERSGEGK